MRSLKILLITAAAVLGMCGPAFAQAETCAGVSLGQLSRLNRFVPFEGTSSPWNADVSSAPMRWWRAASSIT